MVPSGVESRWRIWDSMMKAYLTFTKHFLDP